MWCSSCLVAQPDRKPHFRLFETIGQALRGTTRPLAQGVVRLMQARSVATTQQSTRAVRIALPQKTQ